MIARRELVFVGNKSNWIMAMLFFGNGILTYDEEENDSEFVIFGHCFSLKVFMVSHAK